MSTSQSIVPRILAPLALVAALVALFVVVSSTLEDEEVGENPPTEAAQDEAERERGREAEREEAEAEAEADEQLPQTFYVVREGDSFAGISERTGIPTETLQQLNPGVDPQALQSGERLRLRPEGD